MTASDPRVAVVIATRNRAGELLRTLDHLAALPERPPVVVLDNASTDGTSERVAELHPEVEVVTLEENLGAAARNIGVRRVRTPYVAFSDDDSWWEPGSLGRAVELFDASARLALIVGRILVGPENREDPICSEMADGPLAPEPDLPGTPVLGFLACAAVVRRSAYLSVGGFEDRVGVGGEEDFLACALASAGWGLSYVPDVVAHHHPSKARDSKAMRRAGVRNALWLAWMRRPASVAARQTLAVLKDSSKDEDVRAGALAALQSLPWAARRRRVVPRKVEADLKALDERRGLRALTHGAPVNVSPGNRPW